MKTPKSLKPIKKFLKKHWRNWTILAILGIITYIGFIFYNYLYKPVYQPEELIPQKLEIDVDAHQQIMDFYHQEQENINIIINKEYPNPFK